MERLDQIAAEANKRVLFQTEAIKLINERLRVRLSNVEKPRPIFIVMDGPNGVGKSELARVISTLQTGRLPLLIEGNKYEGQASSWQLLGSGKGFVDSMQGGDLESLRQNPNQVVLIDEGNLADSSFWKTLFQLASEGSVNDNRGRPIDGKNAIFLIAANFTQEYATYKNIWTDEQTEHRFQLPAGTLNGMSQAEKDARVLDRAMELRGVPPGMRDRMAGKVIFNAFDLPKTIAVARLQLAEQVTYIFQEHRVVVRFADNVAEAIAKAGFDMEFNVRPIDRARSNNISVLMADLSRQWKPGDTVDINFEPAPDGKGGRLVAKANGVDVPHVKDVIFKSLVDPKAAAARAAGEAGHPKDPTDLKEIVDWAAKKGGKK
jgi:ATP-dependent Clp protease ATP-binding subunit ClpB